MKPKLLRLCVLACLAFLLMPLPASCQVTVVFTRHAEKGPTPPKNPPLTEAGKKRAETLASMLADSGVDAIYVTEFQRTQLTAAPLAARVHLKPVVLPAHDIAALVKAIHARQSGVVVVVGHSDTLPEIISALGGPKVEISDSQYDNLFVLTVEGSKGSLLRLHYGDSTAVSGPPGSMDHNMTGASAR